MKTLFLSSLIVFCGLIAYENKKHKKIVEKSEKNFWETESKANSTRKKSLDDLNYITIPFKKLPMDILKENAEIVECHRLLEELSTQKIVNLTGFTNTDLKLKYGTANISYLSDYDQSYTLLVRTLQSWAEHLYTSGYITEAQTILEFSISTNTDVSHSYYLLADIYDKNGDTEKKLELTNIAEKLNSSMNKVIVRTLQGSGPYCGWLHCESDSPSRNLP
ncbi:MAG TPA: hypothetical protein VJY54_10775 [Lachnospiraceae bacterium]|nr:hypothetical protein [Lachnospiraceae bacterium]